MTSANPLYGTRPTKKVAQDKPDPNAFPLVNAAGLALNLDKLPKLYTVMGWTGEYDDYHQWSVVTFKTEAKAEAYAKLANKWLKDNGLLSEERGTRIKPYDKEDLISSCPFDPSLSVDYTGAAFYVNSIRFYDEAE